MSPDWLRSGLIAPGGTVVGLAGDPNGNLWAASPAGLFARQDKRWQPITRGIPFQGTSAVLTTQETLFVAGLPHGMIRSPDFGKTWHLCWTEQTDAPITCLVASPNFDRDGVLFAGTDGDGILRSIDRGRFWRLENFGLHTFVILSLATAPVWGHHEPLFAGTDHGLYQSPNGGRAWRPIGDELAGKKVHALLVSPDFATDSTLYAGTESHGLFQSCDGGRHWQPFPLGGSEDLSINCLEFTPDGEILIGTSDRGIISLREDGTARQHNTPVGASVLCLTKIKGQTFAGLSEGGITQSSNGGATWFSSPGISVRRFNWLAATSEQTLIAAGYAEGVWVSHDAGASWEAMALPTEAAAPLALAADRAAIWVGTSKGVLTSIGERAAWVWARKSTAPVVAIACAGGQIWVAEQSGKLWTTLDNGNTWKPSVTPFDQVRVLALEVSPEFVTDRTLAAAVLDQAKNRIQVWCSTDAGDHWTNWFDERATWPAIQLSLRGYQGEKSVLGWGTQCLSRSGQGWQHAEITTPDAPITALTTTSDPDRIIAAIANEVVISTDAQSWEVYSQGLTGTSIVDLRLSPNFSIDQTIWGLALDGEIWKQVVT